MFHRRFQDGQWVPPLSQDPEDVSGSPGPPNTARQSVRPDIAIGPAGEMHTVWWWTQDHNIGSTTSYTIGEVYYSRWDGVNWVDLERLSDSNNKSLVPTVAVDGEGTIHVAWHYHSDSAGDNAGGEIQYRSKPRGGSWSDIEQVSDGLAQASIDPSLAAGGNGNAYLTWHAKSGYGMYYARRTLSGWSRPEQVDWIQHPDWGLPCRLAYGPGFGAQLAFERYNLGIGTYDIYYTQLDRGGVTKHYSAGGQRIATRVDDGLYYLHTDHLGSTALVTDKDGAEVGRVQYAPYGTVITNTLPVTLTDRLFTGQRFESDLGLYDYRARFYDPLVGSFISADTVVPEVGQPRGWNRYAYVKNNPVRYSDPSGHNPPPQGPNDPPWWISPLVNTWERLRLLVPDAGKVSVGGSYIGPPWSVLNPWSGNPNPDWVGVGTSLDFVFDSHQLAIFYATPELGSHIAEVWREDSGGLLPFTIPSIEVAIDGGAIWTGNNMDDGFQTTLEGPGAMVNPSLAGFDVIVALNVDPETGYPPHRNYDNPNSPTAVTAVSFGYSYGYPDLASDFTVIPTETKLSQPAGFKPWIWPKPGGP